MESGLPRHYRFWGPSLQECKTEDLILMLKGEKIWTLSQGYYGFHKRVETIDNYRLPWELITNYPYLSPHEKLFGPLSAFYGLAIFSVIMPLGLICVGLGIFRHPDSQESFDLFLLWLSLFIYLLLTPIMPIFLVIDIFRYFSWQNARIYEQEWERKNTQSGDMRSIAYGQRYCR